MIGVDPRIFRLYLVTDSASCGSRHLADVVRAAVQGGVTCVQLREKSLGTPAFLARAHLLKEVLAEAPSPVPLIINDRLDIALACGAEGVHVGQSDMPPEVIREHMPHALIGLSVESVADARRVGERAAPVDYLGVSPVFPTRTKADTAAPLGLNGLAAIRALTPLPLVAIGGIALVNAAAALSAGADGLAVVSAILAAPDPRQATQALMALIEEHERMRPS
jgi:thiamine-phosphate pyrophosphorylase